MRATLTFDVPKERTEHLYAVHGAEAFAALREVNQWLRNRVKYGELGEETVHELEDVRRVLREAVEGLEDLVNQ